MAVVAVLLIHIDKNAVTPMKPSINLSETEKWRKSDCPVMAQQPVKGVPRFLSYDQLQSW